MHKNNKKTGSHENIQRQYKIYLNRKRLPVGPIIKDLRLKLDDVD